MRALRIIVILLIVLLAIGLVMYLLLDRIAASVVRRAGSRMTGTRVEVDSAAVSPMRGTLTLSGLRVANPEGFEGAYALRLHSLFVQVDTGTLFSRPMVINRVTLVAPNILYDATPQGSNLGRILERTSEQASEDEQRDEPARVVIDRLMITNGNIRLSAPALGGASADIAMPPIELTDIGQANSGVTAATVVSQILLAMRDVIAETVPDVPAFLEEKIGDIGDVSSEGLEQAEELLRRGRERIDQEAERALEELEGILGGGSGGDE